MIDMYLLRNICYKVSFCFRLFKNWKKQKQQQDLIESKKRHFYVWRDKIN